MEDRVLVMAPFGRDARLIGDALAARRIEVHVCQDARALIREIEKGSAATVLTEESLDGTTVAAFRELLAQQPPWSDYPFVVLAARQTVRRTDRARSALQELSNLVLLERPVNVDTLVSAAQSALRARQRQYLTRKHLAELQASKASVEQINGALESRIAERTADLASANDRLMREMLERERIENSLVQNQKMEALGRLTGGIAHDFNNLLHVVNLNLQLIERLKVNEERVRDYARRAKEAVDRGSRLTGQLLSFARTQSLVPRLHDLNALIRNMAELISISVGSHVRLNLALCAQPAFVIVDAAQMEMAILNLSVNARDAMPQGGTLEICTQISPAGVEGAAGEPGYPLGTADVTVRDTGTGIPENLLDKVFDPFFTTKQHAGTGLGLSQVYGFARQSGGSAIVESAVGAGTSIRLRFPLAPGPTEAAQETAAAGRAIADARQAEILVVEDDPGVRRSMVESLQVLGFRVRQAADGASGLLELRKAKPDLLLVDYLMPHMNGAELIAHAQTLYADIPILMATGYADMNAVERLIGPQSVLAKPFDLDTLGSAVAAELQRRKLPT
ncbi:signal transduction histidine kinase/ActR/RegA family two-component response regulator [Variovorax sp. W1I1]|uniref:response regulator n=1 Tax=Variovorax sp. W1I1 TaxID=3042309 RepID=UPI00277F2869|nr:response regulator [Variovorax sp. W1I1]MDQ0608017.1 signal transduction histidine kinase/ActR/RegA family two-component response regulator [Variovorax sp. W1I1]